MLLYIALTLWFMIVVLLGIRKDAVQVAVTWPNIPNNRVIRQNNRISKLVVLMSMLVLWMLTAFRSTSIGNDTLTYVEYFYYFSNYGIIRDSRFEIGYQYLNIAIGWISKNPHIFLVLISSIMYIGLSYCLFRYSRNILISATLFFCYGFSLYINIFRQGIAMIIVLFAYQHLKKNNRLYAFLLIIFASFFHISALICLLLFFNTHYIYKKKVTLLCSLLCLALAFSGYVEVIASVVFPEYLHYFDSKYASTGWLAVTIALIRNATLYCLVASVNKVKDKANYRITLMNFFCLLEIGALGYSVNLFDRLSNYFLLIALIELPNILYQYNIKYRNTWILGICIYSIIMFLLILALRPEWNHLYPYKFYN